MPGGAASAATVLDGFPMAKKGEAGRALSAAYMSSLMGGVFGAVLMAISIPILRPVMLFIGSPELLAFSVLGISMVIFFMRYEARERWSLVVPYAVELLVFSWFAFDYFMAVPWPPTLGQFFPLLKTVPSV